MHHIFATAYTLFFKQHFYKQRQAEIGKKNQARAWLFALRARFIIRGWCGVFWGCAEGRVRMFEPGCMIGGGGDRVGAALQWILSLKSFGNSWDNS